MASLRFASIAAKEESSACSQRSLKERQGVLVGAFQSEREEETRD